MPGLRSTLIRRRGFAVLKTGSPTQVPARTAAGGSWGDFDSTTVQSKLVNTSTGSTGAPWQASLLYHTPYVLYSV